MYCTVRKAFFFTWIMLLCCLFNDFLNNWGSVASNNSKMIEYWTGKGIGGNGLGKFLYCISLSVWRDLVKLREILVCFVSGPRVEQGGILNTKQVFCPFNLYARLCTSWKCARKGEGLLLARGSVYLLNIYASVCVLMPYVEYRAMSYVQTMAMTSHVSLSLSLSFFF